MTDRDKLEVGSKFWNTGKWNNFVFPFLPGDCKGMTLIDMGCNSGLFLKLAQDKGFERVVGVDSDEKAVNRGLHWRDKTGGSYKLILSPMEKIIDELPVSDYTILANSHYYFKIDDFLEYLDKLQYKTRFCIVVTAEKRHMNRCWASAGLEEIRSYFKTWQETGFIDELPDDNDPSYRRLWGLCFKSPFIERVPMDSLDCGNHVQDQFYDELDQGTDFHRTRYYRILKPYRKDWPEEKLNGFVTDKISLYEDLKKNGPKKPLLVDSKNLILDGNHRYSMMKTLGYKEVLIRRT
jgi:hypothetical protein